MLGPIQQVVSPAAIVTPPDPVDQQQQQEQQQQQDQQQQKSEDKQKNGDDSDDTSVEANLNLINSGPVQVKVDLEQPVTSGGMDTINIDPGGRN